MKCRYSVRVLSSFIFNDGNTPYQNMGRDNRWFRGLAKSVLQNGLSLSDFDFQFISAPSTTEGMLNIAADFKNTRVKLVICAGTDTALRWSQANKTLPSLYFGAHPENNGLELIEQPYISGVRLNLPLIWNRKNFSLLKELMPALETLFIPINLTSEFAFPNVRANYRMFRRLNKGFWIPNDATYVGYRSVAVLADSIGCQYHEGPYLGLEELTWGLDQIAADGSNAIIGFNDTALMDGAVDLMLGAARRGVPLFWVNNPSIIKVGGIADFSSDFEKVGQLLGDMAVQILIGKVDMADIEFAPDPGECFTLNLARCGDFGLSVPDPLVSRFHKLQR